MSDTTNKDDRDEGEEFPWIGFYESIADQLLQYKDDRTELVAAVHEIASRNEKSLTDRFKDGTEGPLQDICPFTVMALFNLGSYDKSKAISTDLAKFLNVPAPSDQVFQDGNGVPVLMPVRAWFFGYEAKRQDNDIDNLWTVFAEALKFADSGDLDARTSFASAFDDAREQYGVNWNLTFGLYWARPWVYPALDSYARDFIGPTLNIRFGSKVPEASDYLALIEQLKEKFQQTGPAFSSFPDLCTKLYWDNDWSNEAKKTPNISLTPAASSHSLNTILYGPPGTGKTYTTTARCVQICDGEVPGPNEKIRSRYAELIEEGRVEFITFHQSYGYEEFVEGLRPQTAPEDGTGFQLVSTDGVLKRIAKHAQQYPKKPHVLVIDEINRANVSKVLGELVTLLEEDKRAGQEHEIAVRLPFSHDQFALPPNLYILGTMNTADRSIALLDTALRRRFDFEELPPKPNLLEEAAKSSGIDLPKVLSTMNKRLEHLLDRDHLIGHAWLMGITTQEAVDSVMRRKIIPLIAEYFYDDWGKVCSVLGGTSNGFVKRRNLDTPPDLAHTVGEERYRWTIRKKFQPDAYDVLTSGPHPTRESPEE